MSGRGRELKRWAFGDAPRELPTSRTLAVPPAATCQWPDGDPRQPGFRFCGAPSAAGKSYCPAHCSRAFIPGGQGGRFPVRHWTLRAPPAGGAAAGTVGGRGASGHGTAAFSARAMPPAAGGDPPPAASAQPPREAVPAQPPVPARRGAGGRPFARRLQVLDPAVCRNDVQQAVVRLFNQGATIAGIAAALGLKKNTVSGITHRLREMMARGGRRAA